MHVCVRLPYEREYSTRNITEDLTRFECIGFLCCPSCKKNLHSLYKNFNIIHESSSHAIII